MIRNHLRHLRLACLVAMTPGPLGAQTGGMTSAPITEVRYTVTFTEATAANRELTLEMSFRTPGTDAVLLSLPAWTPGAYEISNFARKVLNFSATSDGRPLIWDKVDFDTWRVQPEGVQSITVSFSYAADSLDNAMAWSTSDFVLFNGTNVFLYPEGRSLNFPARITIRTEPEWTVATGMRATGTRGEYGADDFHELVDMPVFVGNVDLDSMWVDGTWHRLATYPAGVMTGPGRQTLWTQLGQVMPPMSAVFGETPWETYTTMLIFDESYAGGSALEHQNSHVGIYNPAFIGNPILASITAHEIFHAWNVKRLRPADMVPYDYARPQPTTLLWVSEGITDYYADLALLRGGVIPAPIFYQITAGKVDEVANTTPVSLEDASLSTWIDVVDGTRYVYYPKGSLAGLLLDISIRDASNNRASLDDVMRSLYRSTFKGGSGFTTEQWWAAVREAAGGRAFDTFATRYIEGRDVFPYSRMLALGGFRFIADSARVPRIGVSTAPDSLGIVVTSVVPGSAAGDAGVATGDYLIRVGTIEVTSPAFGQLFRTRYASAAAGTPIEIVIRRAGETRTLASDLRFGQVVNYAVRADPNAGPKAVRIREGILRGETQP